MKKYKYEKIIYVVEDFFQNKQVLTDVFTKLIHCMIDTNIKNNENCFLFCVDTSQYVDAIGCIGIRLQWGIRENTDNEK